MSRQHGAARQGRIKAVRKVVGNIDESDWTAAADGNAAKPIIGITGQNGANLRFRWRRDRKGRAREEHSCLLSGDPPDPRTRSFGRRSHTYAQFGSGWRR